MEILRALKQRAEQDGLSYLVIGGHALNAFGSSRQTRDLDLAVRSADLQKWKEYLLALRYTVVHEQPAFCQFKAPELAMWPVDLMILDDATFTRLVEKSSERDFLGVRCRVPSPRHLIAMKLHAFKGGHPDRHLKDLHDIMFLLKQSEFDVSSTEFRDFCLKYGNEALLKKIIETDRERRGW